MNAPLILSSAGSWLRFGRFVSPVSVVLFRSFRFVVSGFSICLYICKQIQVLNSLLQEEPFVTFERKKNHIRDLFYFKLTEIKYSGHT